MKQEIRHFHVFCGCGGGAKGFNQGEARIGSMKAEPRCIGGIDVMPEAIQNFTQFTGTQGTLLDLFDRQQYIDWHGHEPPADWQEVSPQDIQKAASNERPHIVFTSPPCKGFSGLLSQKKSQSQKYAALNRLTVRGIFLCMEAWKDDPPEFFLMENVPRIENRGGELLDQIEAMLRHYGYATARTTHDCGEIAGLAQSRKRFLLIARHVEKIPPFVYEPVVRPLNNVGSVIGGLPMPGDDAAGPMHTLPSLQWKTWVRLAFVQAGKDWRSISDLEVSPDGFLKNYLMVPEYFPGYLGVNRWEDSMGAIPGRSTVTNGAFSIADPRASEDRWGGGKYRITPWLGHANAVIGASTTGEGAFAVEDPRPGLSRQRGDSYLTAAHYGIVEWEGTAGAVTAAGRYDNGKFSVADPRGAVGDCPEQPKPNQKMQCVITSLDGTWHRPFTTLELAALQGLVDPGEYLEMHGTSHEIWREQIGNMVPPTAAQAIFEVIAESMLLAWTGETFHLGSTPIWVKDIAAAIAVRQDNDNYWR